MGPLANMLCKLAAKRESTHAKLNEIIAIYTKLTGKTIEVSQLHSTLGRIIGRTVHCCELQNVLQDQYNALIVNIGKGDHTTFRNRISRQRVNLKVSVSSKRRAVCCLTGW